MKHLLIALLIIFSLPAISQRTRVLSGFDPSTGMPGYQFKDTAKTPVAISPLLYDGDSTFSLSTVPATKGGTGLTTYATGDILYASGANALSKLPIGANGQTLTITGGIPSWVTVAAGGGGSGTGWAITGNSGTTVANFIGTTDAQSLRLATNGVNRMTVDSVDGGTTWDFPYSTNGAHFSISPGTRLGGNAFNLYMSGGPARYADFGSGISLIIGTPANPIISISSSSVDYTKIVNLSGGWKYNHLATFVSSGYTGVTWDGTSSLWYYAIRNQNGTLPFLLTPKGNLLIGSTGALYDDEILTSTFTVKSTTEGTIPYSRMTTTQRTAIALGADNDGLAVYDITLHKLFINEGGTWTQK